MPKSILVRIQAFWGILSILVLTSCNFNTDILREDGYSPIPSFSVSDADSVEGTSVNFNFNLEEPAKNSYEVHWSVNYIDSDSDDLIAISGFVVVEIGDTSFTISIPTQDDSSFEANEKFNLVLTKINGKVTNQIVAKGTIENDDPTPTVSFQNAAQTKLESAGAATALIILGNVSGLDVTLPYTVSGTANGSDHDLVSGTVVIPAGDLAAGLTLSILNDVNPEVDETIIITLGTPTNGQLGVQTTHTITIQDNDGVVNITSPLAASYINIGNQNSITVSGNCTTSGVEVTVSVDDTNGGTTAVTPGTQPTCTAGSFTVNLDLSSLDDDSITVNVDHASANDSLVVTKDTVAPTVAISAPIATDYINNGNASSFTVTGSCSENGQSVTVSADDTNGGTAAVIPGTQPTCTAGSYSVNLDLSSLDDDTITITADHSDAANNNAIQASVSLTKDTGAPTVTITSPIATNYINIGNEATFTVSGNCSENGRQVTISADDTNGGTTAVIPGTQPTCSAGSYTVNLNLSSLDDDTVTITADHSDIASNNAIQASVSLTKDTGAPTVVITSPLATDYIHNGNVAAFTISGNCSENGQEVTISADDTNGGTTAVTPGTQPTCSAGSFTVNLDLSGLDDDTITITANHSDLASNSATQASVSLTKDATLPTVTITSPLATDYVNIGNESSFTVSGSCSENGREVIVSADDTNGGTSAVTPGTQPTCAAGSYTVNLDLSSLDDDTLTITADHSDIASNSANQASVSLTKDTGAPTVTITSPIATDYINISNEASFTVSGSCSENGQEVTVSADDTNGGTTAVTPGTQPTCSAGSFTVNLDLSGLDDDTITITADHSDIANNSAPQASVALTKDTGAPTVTITSPIATDYINISNEASFTVSGSCSEDGREITISADDTNGGTAAVTPGTQPTCSAGSYTVNLNLSSLEDDTITITADHSDISSNSATQASVSLTKDTLAPTVAITSPILTDYIHSGNVSSFTVSGTCSDNGQEVTIAADDTNGVTATVAPGTQPTCSAGSFTVNLDLSGLDDDTITITADHSDLAGNSATQDAVSLTKDTGLPTVSITSPIATDTINDSNVTSFTVTGNCSENGQEVTVSADDTNGGTTAVTPGTQPTCTAGSFTVNLDLSGLDDDTITITADHTDVANNSATQASVSLTKDASLPTVTITSPLATNYINIGNENAFTVSGTCSENGQEVTVSADDTNGGTTAITPGTQPTCTAGSFTVNLNLSSLDDDTITITADHSDVASNSALQASVSLVKDTGAPTVTIASPIATDYIHIGNENAFTISGSCSENGQQVTISADDTNGGTTAVTPGTQPTCAAGNYTVNLDLSSLDDDTITITADHSDVASNSATQSSVSLTKDTGTPTVIISSPIATDFINIGNENAFTISGSCSENGREVTISADDTNGGTTAVTPGTQPTCAAGSYTVNLNLSSLDDDTITITADHSDIASNSATQATVSLTKDTGAPTVTITSPLAADYINSSNENLFTVSGSCSENGREVTITANDGISAITPGTQPTCSAGNYTVNLNLSSLVDGAVTITADHSDAAANSATQATVSLTKDTGTPTVTFTSPIATDYINNGNQSTFIVSGSCSENGKEVTISADDTNGGTTAVTPGTQPTCTAGSYTVNLDLSSLDDDTITITADHEDVAGNSATQATVSLTKDSVAPTIAVNQSISETVGSCSFTNQSDPAVTLPLEFKVTFSEAITGSSFIIGDVSNGGTGGGTTLTWTITSCGDNQNYSLKATAVAPMGTIVPSIGIGLVDDVAGNSNTSASSSTDNSIQYIPNAFLWIGAASPDTNWSTGANWSGGNAPGASDVATFDNTCGSNCNVTVNTDVSIAGINMEANFPGTITHASSQTIIVGASGWIMAGGSFVGGDSNITLNGASEINGGSFTATSANLIANDNFKIDPATTFNSNNGTFKLYNDSGTSQVFSGNKDFNNVVIESACAGAYDFNSETMSVNGQLELKGNCTASSALDNGTIIAKGDIVVTDAGKYGSALIKIAGSNNQNINTTAGTGSFRFPSLEIASTGGIVSVTGPSLNLYYDYIYTSGSINWNSADLKFLGNGPRTVVPGAIDYPSVTFNQSCGGVVDLNSGTMKVTGDLSLIDGCASGNAINNGTFELYGDLSILGSGKDGNAAINFVGPNPQSITATGTEVPSGNWIINKTNAGDTVSLLSNLSLNSTGQDLTIINGDFDLNFNNLVINDQMTVGDGIGAANSARILKGCSLVTVPTQNTNSPDGAIIGSSSNPSITISDATTIEGGNLVFNVTLSEGVCFSNFTVNYTVNDGTATSTNSDYSTPATDSDATPTDGILTLSSAATSGTITIASTTDTTLELDETLTVVLDTPSHGSLSDATAVGTIENDDDNGFIWTGNAGDNNFSNGANWSNGVNPPGPSDVALFDDTCNDIPANCDVATTSSVTVAGIWLASNFPGTFTQSGSNTILVGVENLIIQGGTFSGGSATIHLGNGIFIQSGGSFTSTSGELLITTTTTSRLIFQVSGGTFNHNSGTVRATGGRSTSEAYTFQIPNNFTFFNLTLDRSEFNSTPENTYNFSNNNLINVANNFTLTNSFNGKTQVVSGIFKVLGNIYANPKTSGGTAVLELIGSADQEYHVVGDGTFPVIKLNKPSGSLVAGTGTTDLKARKLFLENGTFSGPTNEIHIEPNILDTSGDVFQYLATANYINNGGNVKVSGGGWVNRNYNLLINKDLTIPSLEITRTFTGASVPYNNVTTSGSNSLTVSNLLVLSESVSGQTKFSGTINLEGNMISGPFDGGSGNITFTGSAAQTIQSSGTLPEGTFTINKSASSLKLLTNLNLSGSSQSLVVANGDLELNSFNLDVNGSLTVGDGTGAASSARVLKNCSTITAGSQTVNPTDGEIVESSSNPNISISDATVAEGGNLVFNVTLSEGVCASDFTLNYTVNDSTATTANSDYSTPATDSDATPTDGILTLSSAATSGTITVATTADSTLEFDENLTVVLDTPSHGSFVDHTGVGTIENDDDNGFIWTGNAGDNDLNNGLNWSNGTNPPGPSDIAFFDDTCNDVPSNCPAIQSANWNSLGIWINEDFPSTITQSGGNTITVGASDWIQHGGTFVGASNDIIANEFRLYGGSFTSTTAKLIVGRNQNTTSDVDGFIVDGGTFTHNSGTLELSGSCNGNTPYNSFIDVTYVKVPSGIDLHHLVVDITDTLSANGSDDCAIKIDGPDTITVNGDLTIKDGLLTSGMIDLKGDLILGYTNTDVKAEKWGTTVVKFSGNVPQTITGTVDTYAPMILVNTTSTVTATSDFGLTKFFLYGGTFNAPSGTMKIYPLTSSSGTTNGFTFTGGAFNHNSGTLELSGICDGNSWYNNFMTTLVMDVPSGVNLNNLKINTYNYNNSNGYDDCSIDVKSGHTVTVLGDLEIRDGLLESGTINLHGNLVMDEIDSDTLAEQWGTTLLRFVGNTSQTISGTANTYGPRVEIATTGSVTPAGGTTDFGFTEFKLTSGTFTAPSGTMTINPYVGSTNNTDGFTIAGGTYLHNSGTLKLAGTGGSSTASPRVVVKYSAPGYTMNNVVIATHDDNSAGGSDDSTVDLSSQQMIVGGNLYISNGKVTSGDVAVYGNARLAYASTTTLAEGGNYTLTFSGSSDSTFTIDSGAILTSGSITLAKDSGVKVTLANPLDLSSAGQDLYVYNGDLELNTYDLSVNDQLVVGDAIGSASTARILQDCSSITAGSQSVNPADGEIVGSSSNPNISISDASVTEGGNLVFNVTLSEGVCASDFTVNYASANGSATTANSDYVTPATDSDATPSDGTLTLSAGTLSGTVTVVTTPDATMEVDETMSITLSSASHGAIIDNTGIGTILNDDDNGFIWTGNAGDGDFSNGANWSNGLNPPGSGDVAMFDETCNDVPANCDAQTTAATTLTGLWINSDYPGTLTQSSGNTLTVGSSDFIQQGGTFQGGNSKIDLNRLYLRGGTFNSTTNTLELGYGVGLTLYVLNVSSGAIFNHNNGTVDFFAESNGCSGGISTVYADVDGSLDLYNLRFITASNGCFKDSYFRLASSDKLVVLNNFTHAAGVFRNGTIELHKDLYVNSNAKTQVQEENESAYTGFIKFVGSGDQEYNYTVGTGGFAGTACVVVDKPSGTVQPMAGTNSFATLSLQIENGSFSSPSSYLRLGGLHHNGGTNTIEMLKIAATGSFVSNSATTRFNLGNKNGCGGSTTNYRISTPTDLTFSGNVEVREVFYACGSTHNLTTLNSNALIVNGDFSYIEGGSSAAAGIDGNWVVRGDLTLQGSSTNDGAASFTLDGSSNQTIITNTTVPSGAIIINKPSGTVLLGSSAFFNRTGQDLTIENGVLDLNGYNLNVSDQLNVGDGVGSAGTAQIIQGCGSITAGTQTVNPADGLITAPSNNPDITVGDTSTIEGGDLIFTVTLSEPVCGTDFTVSYATYIGTTQVAPADYTDVAGSLTINSGLTAGTVTVYTTADSVAEKDEYMKFKLTNASQSHGTLVDNEGLGLIYDDDGTRIVPDLSSTGTNSNSEWDGTHLRIASTYAGNGLTDGTWMNTTGLVGYWRLNEATAIHNSTIVDEVGSQDGTFVTNDGSTEKSILTPTGSGIELDGADDYISLPNNAIFNPGGIMSSCLWFYSRSQQSGKNLLAQDVASGRTPTTYSWLGAVVSGSSRYVRTYVSQGTAKYLAQYDGGSNGYFDHSWHHVCMTFDKYQASGHLKLYVDGILRATTNTSLSDIDIGGHPTIGIHDHSVPTFFDGKIDDISLWHRALEADEIRKMYYMQKAKRTGVYTSDILDAGSSKIWRYLSWAPESPYIKELLPLGRAEGLYPTFAVNMSPGTANNELFLNLNETGSPTTFADQSSSSNDFSCTNCPKPVKHGRFAGAMQFDGFNDVITRDDASLNNTQFTVSLWMKPFRTPDNSKVESVIFKKVSTSNNYSTFSFSRDHSNVGGENSWRFHDGVSWNSLKYTGEIPTDRWSHLLVTYDGTYFKLYLNGAYDGQMSGTPSFGNAPLYIGSGGATSSPANFFNGEIDEVAIWDKALSAEDIANVYQRGENRLHIQIRSCSDATCSTNPEFVGYQGTGETVYNELENTTVGPPSLNMSGDVSNSQYFQYRIYMESDKATGTPKVNNLRIVGE
ncbi:MAG: hypothetical protein KDD61_07450 [Bdellovibrionales bacterium]|nr:hypothetical protein [Bdellovibrionales bacterium]